MSALTRWLDARLYPDCERNWDDNLFRVAILRHLGSEHMILDLGAGAGIVKAMNFRGLACRACGVDPDERVLDNPFLDQGKVGTGEAIPYSDASFDLVFADNVLEHLPDPEAVFREVARVLKPGGVFLAKTPNKYHYVPLIVSLTPHRFHQWICRLRGRAAVDTFPTRYRANTPAAVARHAEAAGLEVRKVSLIEGRPEYLRFSAPTYLLGWVYERLVNKIPGLQRLRVLLIAELCKPREYQP